MNGLLSSFRARLLSILVVINVCVLGLGTSSYFLPGQGWGKASMNSRGAFTTAWKSANRLRTAAQDRAIAVRNLALIDTPDERARVWPTTNAVSRETTESLAELQRPVSANPTCRPRCRLASRPSPRSRRSSRPSRRRHRRTALKNGQREAADPTNRDDLQPNLWLELNEAIQAYTSLL